MVLQAPMWGEDIEKCAAQTLSLCESRRALVLGYPEDVLRSRLTYAVLKLPQ